METSNHLSAQIFLFAGDLGWVSQKGGRFPGCRHFTPSCWSGVEKEAGVRSKT